MTSDGRSARQLNPASVTTRLRSVWIPFATTVLLVLSGRLLYLVARFSADGTRARRPQIESAALLLALVGIALRASRIRQPTSIQRAFVTVPLVTFAAMTCAALALFWPALSIGLLSDDFVLTQHAARWEIGPVSVLLFRPLPLTIWAVMLHLGANAIALHTLNLVLHGTNACLTIVLIREWVPGKWWAVAAGVLVLTCPLAPEAVAWCAGIFDVLATTLVLAAVLVARRYDRETGIGTRMLFLAAILSALLSKETAVVGPILVAIDAWVRRARSRRLMQDILIGSVLVALFGAFRVVSQSGVLAPVWSKYRAQRVLFDTFGTLAAPWHLQLMQPIHFATVLSGLTLIVALTCFFVATGTSRATRGIVGGALWVLASVLPVFPLFYVSPDLQGSRYLYLGAVGWAAILATALAEIAGFRWWLRFVVNCFISLTIGLQVYAVRLNLGPWAQAAAMRDRILQAVATDGRLHSCTPVNVTGLPETVSGAYVFRNGVREAFKAAGLDAVTDSSGACAFRWNTATEGFESVPPQGR